MNNKFTFNENAVGLIPARGGSKSIPLKNMIPLNGTPIIDYAIKAGKQSTLLKKLYCSTDHKDIMSYCEDSGVVVIPRPKHLGKDDTPIADVIQHFLEFLSEKEGEVPEYVALLQPTSPFILAQHIDDCVLALKHEHNADSAQTISPVVHNSHAYNQRVIQNGFVQFRFLEERRAAFNKQLKPKHFVFGNIVVTRSRSLLTGKDCFGDVSIPVEIPRIYAMDIDTVEDVEIAAYLIKEGKVKLK